MGANDLGGSSEPSLLVTTPVCIIRSLMALLRVQSIHSHTLIPAGVRTPLGLEEFGLESLQLASMPTSHSSPVDDI